MPSARALPVVRLRTIVPLVDGMATGDRLDLRAKTLETAGKAGGNCGYLTAGLSLRN